MNQAHWRGRTGLPSSPGELGVEPWRAGCRALASWVSSPGELGVVADIW